MLFQNTIQIQPISWMEYIGSCHMSPVTCPMSPIITPTATATDPLPPPNSSTMHYAQ